jgi:hypothetical protein
MKHYFNNSLAYQNEKLVVLDPAINKAKAMRPPTFEFAIGRQRRPSKEREHIIQPTLSLFANWVGLRGTTAVEEEKKKTDV